MRAGRERRRPAWTCTAVLAVALGSSWTAFGDAHEKSASGGFIADHGLSGTWALEGLAGDRLVLEMRNPHSGRPRWLHEGGLLVFWLTHDAEGRPRVLAGRGRTSGERVEVDEAWSLRGAPLGRGTHDAIERVPWGSITLRFGTCEEGELEHAATAEDGAGIVGLRRLVRIGGLDCGVAIPESRADRVLFSAFDGHWRSRTTQDVLVVQRPDPTSGLLHWIGFDAEGRSTWRSGRAAPGPSPRMVFEDLRVLRGAPFGVPVTEEQLESVPWGRAIYLPESCATAAVAWSERGSGTMDGVVIERRGAVAGTRCADAWPAEGE